VAVCTLTHRPRWTSLSSCKCCNLSPLLPGDPFYDAVYESFEMTFSCGTSQTMVRPRHPQPLRPPRVDRAAFVGAIFELRSERNSSFPRHCLRDLSWDRIGLIAFRCCCFQE